MEKQAAVTVQEKTIPMGYKIIALAVTSLAISLALQTNTETSSQYDPLTGPVPTPASPVLLYPPQR